MSTADEIAKLAALRDAGEITPEHFQTERDKVLAAGGTAESIPTPELGATPDAASANVARSRSRGEPASSAGRIILAVALILAIVVVWWVIASEGGGSSTDTGALPTPPPGASGAAPTTSPAPATTGAPAASAVVLQSEHGSGSSSPPQFTVPGGIHGWTLAWRYNCRSFGQAGNFQAFVESGTQLDINDTPINELGLKGAGTANFFDSGTLHVQINALCSWSYVVRTSP